MDRTAVIICNYNKKEYVIKCVKSLKKQTVKSFDIYIVDNASTDGSPEEILSAFGKEVTLLCNENNLGGSGGFDTGLRYVQNKGYEYFFLLDNDVILDEYCMERLCNDMEQNPDIGIMGAKILKMDYPDIIQEFGPMINYETVTFELCYGGEKDTDALPQLKDCDYVPACALIVRKKVIEEIGILPETNFIYYDDVEWCVRCHKAGYRVVANSSARVWHKGGAAINPTTFSNYYILRNKIKFFTSHMQTEKMDVEPSEEAIRHRAELILRDVFEGIYSCKYKGNINIIKTRMDAFIDALMGKTGRADSFEIREKERVNERLEELVRAADSVLIFMNSCWEGTRRVVFQIRQYVEKLDRRIEIALVDEKYAGEKLLGLTISAEKKMQGQFGLELHMCNHIYKHTMDSLDKKWIDGWGNMVVDEKDYNARQLYDQEYEMFQVCFADRVFELMKENMGVQG